MPGAPVEVLSLPSPDGIGIKREEEQKKIAFWSRVVLICIALLFVGIFVIGPLITPIIGTLRTVKPLETVELQFT
ncbi:MAG: hypothetical protein LUQ03_05745, partial [Methanomicrobiales archaeon]|nr:hypothetical protein [Methanomicrobiales archaeon]